MAGKPGTGRRNVFSDRNFRLVFFGSLVSDLGATLYSFVVSFYILEISGNNAVLQGVYLALCGVMLLLFTPVGGVLGDRFNKAKIMYVCDYIKGSLIILANLLMLLLPEDGAHIAILFAAGILGNIVSGIFSPAAGAILPYIAEDDLLQQANSYFSMKGALLTVFGIVLAGVLYAAIPVHLLFFIVGICYLFSGVSEMFIRYDYSETAEKLNIKLALSDMRDGFIYLKGKKAIMAIILAALFINFFITPLDSNFLPFFVKTDLTAAPSYLFDNFLTPELWYSVFGMLLGLSSLAGSIILSTRPPAEKCGRKIAVRICAMAGIMVTAMLAYWLFVARGVSMNAFLLTFSLGSIALGLSLVFVNIPLNTALMRIVEKDKLSKVTSIISIISQGLIPIASVMAGAVLQYCGSTILLVICSVGITLTALLLLGNRAAREI